jgi:hypothetical protein
MCAHFAYNHDNGVQEGLVRVLVACEYSGRVRDAFTDLGHYAVSVDLLPSDTWGLHWQGDIFRFLEAQPDWDMMIAFPPCTKLSCIGTKHWPRWQDDGSQDLAIDFFCALGWVDIPRIAIENPAGIMSTVWRKPDQYVQPWWFGDPWNKRTGLWLKNLPLLEMSDPVESWGPWVSGGSGRTAEEGAYGTYRAGDRKGALARSATFPGLATAMAEQWGDLG